MQEETDGQESFFMKLTRPVPSWTDGLSISDLKRGKKPLQKAEQMPASTLPEREALMKFSHGIS